MSPSTILFHVSDLHFGAEDRDALDWFMAQVCRERPTVVICTGDLTMRGSAREFAAAREWLAAVPVPLTLEPGNHDVPYYHHMLRRLTRPYARYRALEDAVERPPERESVAVVPLKTVARAQFRLNWSKGRVGAVDLDAALRSLAAHADAPLRLVTAHHPLVAADPGARSSTRGGEAALSALARAGAQAVLTGHVHDPFDLMREVEGRAIRLIGAGTLSLRLRSTPPSYNRLEWSAQSGLTVDVRRMA